MLLGLAHLPMPALIEGPYGSIVQGNAAFLTWLGCEPHALTGQALSAFMPVAEAPLQQVELEGLRQQVRAGRAASPLELCLLTAQGQTRWCRLWAQALQPQPGGYAAQAHAPLLLLLQDISDEQISRVQADRAQEELNHWFELSPDGQVVFDGAGLILRSNPVFDAWLGGAPVTLADTSDTLQQLLGWSASGLRSDLRPGMPPLQTVVDFSAPGLGLRRLLARLRAFVAEDGSCRVMAIVQDQTLEIERDLAQLDKRAALHAAGVEEVTLDLLREAPPAPAEAASDHVDDSPMPIGPDLTLQPASQPAFQRLQQALQAGHAVEVRYAVQHALQGLRWLLTRVEPARLRHGGEVVSVITLDVTEQENSRHQREELLRELTTILDGSPVGIAYLREGRLVRCNLRFERMLGFAPGASAGVPLSELFEQQGLTSPGVVAALQALADGRHCDVEMVLPPHEPTPYSAGNERSWYALSLRRAEPAQAGTEAVAVLTDITRLKLQQAEIERALHERELMFNQSDVGIAWVRNSRIVRANDAMSDLTGLAEADLQDRHITTLYASGDPGPQDFDVRSNLDVLGRHVSEHRLRHTDGTLHWTQVSVRAVDPADRASDLVYSFVDVDERQRSREALQQLAGQTRAVLDSVLVGIVTVGEHGIEWMNRSARRMFAGGLESFLGEPIGCVATADTDHPLIRTDWLQCLANGESESFECRLQARDGRKFWVVGNAVATPSDSTDGRQVTFALLDIEARRQAEVRVSSARASLQRLIETAPLAIALFDAQTLQVVECNQGAEQFFGRSQATLLGAVPEDCMADADQAAALRASLELARDTTEGVRRELTRPGQPPLDALRWDARFVALGPQPADGRGGGEPAGGGQILLVANDVTELRLAEQARLDAAIAQREMLVKEVHHRIKNNLQGVAGLLQQTSQRHPEISVPLEEAIGQVQAIAQVYGLQVGAGGPLDLLGVLRAIAGTVQRSLHHVIEVRGDDSSGANWLLPEAESIPLALSLNELLINAVRHGDGDIVRCVVRSTATHACIEIRNAGQLPSGFEVLRVPTGMYGLGLVRSLLPRRAATLVMEQQGTQVLTALTLRPPSVRRAVV